MSNHNENNNLKNLFKNSDKKSLDDFEKEALEGFESLESEQEALDLKAELDEKIRGEVFFEKRSSVKTYWLAAAALFLVIGLSVVFLMNNGVIENKKDMALMQKEAETEKPEGLKEEPPAQVNAATKDALTPPPAEESAKTGSGVKLQEQQNNRINTGKLSSAEASGEGVAQSPPDSKGDSDNKFAAGKKQAQLDLDTEEKNTEKDRNQVALDDVKESEYKPGKNDESKEESKSLESLSQNKPQEAAELKKESKAGRAKNKRKENAKEPAMDIAGKGVAREDAEVSESAPSIPENENADKKAVTKSVSAAPASSTGNNAGPASIGQKCYYTGGDATLIKDLRTKLLEKNLNKKFDAILYINLKKEVEKVKFTESSDLSKDDKTHVEEILKQLNKFDFTSIPDKTAEYKLVYRP